MTVSRERVMRAIKLLSELIARELRRAVDEGQRPDAEFVLLLERACEESGIEVCDYVLSITCDDELFELQKHAVEEAVLGTTDPGPYDVISRESPAGTPANYHIETLWAFGGG